MNKIQQWLFIAVVTLSLQACVTSPTGEEYVSPHQPIEFNGYAFSPGAQVQLKAFNKLTNTWETVQTTTASTTAFTVGGDDLYGWSTTLVFTSIPGWQCFWGSPCILNPPAASASVKVEEQLPNGGVLELITFDQGYISCLTEKLSDGEGAFAAGWQCRGEDSPIIYLKTLT